MPVVVGHPIRSKRCGDDELEGSADEGDGGRFENPAGDAGGKSVGVDISKKLGSFCIVVIGSPTNNLVCTDP